MGGTTQNTFLKRRRAERPTKKRSQWGRWDIFKEIWLTIWPGASGGQWGEGGISPKKGGETRAKKRTVIEKTHKIGGNVGWKTKQGRKLLREIKPNREKGSPMGAHRKYHAEPAP